MATLRSSRTQALAPASNWDPFFDLILLPAVIVFGVVAIASRLATKR